MQGGWAMVLLAFAFISGVIVMLAVSLIGGSRRPMRRVIRAICAGGNTRIRDAAPHQASSGLARSFDAMVDLLKGQIEQLRARVGSLQRESDGRATQIRVLNEELNDLSRLFRESRREQLAQTERLAAVGELIAGVAHEINNPLAVILAYLNLLTRELGPTAWSVHQEVDHVVRQVYRVQRIIDSLLYLARPMDDVDLLTPLDITNLLNESLSYVCDQRQRPGVTVTRDLRGTTLVRIGRQDLQQIIVNLLANAFDAVPTRAGQIAIHSRNWQGRGLVLSIKDNGPGVAAGLAERVFTPFFTTKGPGKGTGLGLSVSAGLIRRYGGALTLESSPGEGAEFTVWVLSEPIYDDDGSWLTQTLVGSLHSPLGTTPSDTAVGRSALEHGT